MPTTGSEAGTGGLTAPSARWRAWTRAAPYLVPIALLLAITLPHLDQGAFRTDTGRYAAVGVQMWRTGELWTPYLQPDTPYFNKPPMTLWIHGAVLHVVGVEVWAARLPTVFAAAVCVVAMVGGVRRFASRGSAMTAGIILATTLEFFRRTKEISMDMWQAAFLLIAVWCVAVAVTGRRTSGSRASSRTGWWYALAGVCVGLGLLCKPFVALAMIPIVGVWLAVWGPRRQIGWLTVTALVAVAVAAPWHVSMHLIHGGAFADQYLGRQIADRMRGEIIVKPWWFYFEEMAQYHWPWLVFTALGLVAWARRPGLGNGRSVGRGDPRGIALAAVWSVAWLVVLSVFPDKRPRYGLVFYPSLAWVAGVWWYAAQPAKWRRGGVRTMPIVAGAVVLAGVVFALLPVRVQEPGDPGFEALAAWMEDNPDREVVGDQFGSNADGWVYCLTGRWVQRVGGPTYPCAEDVPEDAAWVWIAKGGEPVPEGHAELLHVGTVRVTERQ